MAASWVGGAARVGDVQVVAVAVAILMAMDSRRRTEAPDPPVPVATTDPPDDHVGTGSERLERILEDLRLQGGRITASRRIIAGALLDSPHHVTAEELIESVQASHPEIAPSTVYRTLHSLAQLGVVTHVHVGHGPAVYHLADERHIHLVCHTCGTVVEVPDDLLAQIEQRVRRDHGFAIDAQHVALSGRCEACTATGTASPGD
jgi:Fur family transcriptional regulator, ferric uptake regulator